MPVYQLSSEVLAFPPATVANDEGLLAIGGQLREDWLLTAYAQGLFPWYSAGEPIMWWSPDPRCVLVPAEVKVQKSMRPLLNSEEYVFRFDTDFTQVIENCAEIPRHNQPGTWITTEMKEAYRRLHKIGMAHSAEVWRDDELVGGLYGVSIGRVFFGESMFSKEPNTSKLALIRMCRWLQERDFVMVDCQISSDHMSRMGAIEVSRHHFLEALGEGLTERSLKGKWKF